MIYDENRPIQNRNQNYDPSEKNQFLKRLTPRDNPNSKDFYHTLDNRSPIKLSSQMVLNPNYMENDRNRSMNNQIQNNHYNNNYYKEEPFSQSFNVEAERQNRLLQERQRQRDLDNPNNLDRDPNTDYYYKYSRTSSDINDYNNRYTYNYRRDFDYIDFNKLSRSGQIDNNLNTISNSNRNDNFNSVRDNNSSRYRKPFEGPTPASRQRSFEPHFKRKGSDMEPFYKYKNVEYYGQRDPITFGYDEVDDKYRFYSPFRSDYGGSRYGSYIYNYYLNAPMRGDISEDFKYPPQYYYRPKQTDIKPPKVFTNLM